MLLQEKTKQKKYAIYKQWSNGIDESACRRLLEFDGQADLVSSCLYTWQDGKEVAVECRLISLDIDLEKSDAILSKISRKRRNYGQRVLSHRHVRQAIKKAYPEILPYITSIAKSRHTGLSLVVSFPSFLLTDRMISLMALELQRRLGAMLTAIGIGVDQAAYGLRRDIPNVHNRELKLYDSQKKDFRRRDIVRKDQNDYAIHRVLSTLMKLTERHKGTWDERKTVRSDRFLYPDARVEGKLARYYLSELKFIQKFHSQKELVEALGVSVKVVRRIMENPLAWLSIRFVGDGYLVERSRTPGLTARACSLVRGSFHDWNLPHPTEVQDGQRNEYIWRAAVTLKMKGFDQFTASRIVSELARQVPGAPGSKNCKRATELVASIYKTRPFDPKKRGNLKPLPGFDEAKAAVEPSPRNVGMGPRGGVGEKPQIELLEPSPFIAFLDPKGRLCERVENFEQKKLQKKLNQTWLSPLLATFFHKNSFAYQALKSKDLMEQEHLRISETHGFSIRFDIQKFFPSIDQKILLAKLSRVTGEAKASMIMGAVTAPQIIDGEKHERPRGIATGSSFSNALANLYLTDFDFWLEARRVPFVRYCDDIVIHAKNPIAACEALESAKRYLLSELGLTIKDAKTRFSWK